MPSPDHLAIPPYWSRFGSFFLYPLKGEPLLMAVGFGLLYGFSSMMFFLFQLGVLILLVAAMFRYGYKVLERTARGHIEDDLVYFEPTHGKSVPYKQFLVILVGLSLCAYTATLLGPHVTLVLLALLVMVLPANTMILAITGNLGDSMAPPRLWAILRGIGLPYLGLCACLLLLSASNFALLRFLLPIVPKALAAMVVGFVGCYFLIVMFRLMGYVLYQYHEALGFPVDVGFERQAPAVTGADPLKQRAKRRAALLREGRFEEALAEARQEVAGQSAGFSANLKLYRLLLAIPGQEAALAEHARRWLPLLLDTGQEKQAVEVAETLRQIDPAPPPLHAEHILALARACLENRRYDTATSLMQGFDRRFPRHPVIADIYVLGARLLIEHQRDESQARRILEAVASHYPDTPAAAEAAKLTELIDRLAAARSGKP